MEKRDIIVIFAAIIIVLIMAVVVKPMLTGQPVILLPESPVPEITPIEQFDTPLPSEPVSTPVEQKTPEKQELVEPTASPVVKETSALEPTPEITPMTWQPEPDNPMPAVQMTNYAEIVGKYAGSTSSFRIPTPYWEIHYNVTPANQQAVFSMDVQEVSDGAFKTIRTITWKEGKEENPQDYRFFEGGKEYLLNINANQLDEYRITIQIPLKYIRDT